MYTILLIDLNVHACMRACDDFLKGNIYDSFMYKSFVRKILIATVYYFHSPFLNLPPFPNTIFFVGSMYTTSFLKGKIIVLF